MCICSDRPNVLSRICQSIGHLFKNSFDLFIIVFHLSPGGCDPVFDPWEALPDPVPADKDWCPPHCAYPGHAPSAAGHQGSPHIQPAIRWVSKASSLFHVDFAIFVTVFYLRPVSCALCIFCALCVYWLNTFSIISLLSWNLPFDK